MDVTMMLCDAATESGGKLFILGGGWSIVRGGQPAPMALAIKMSIPWDQANRPFKVVTKLIDEDGNAVAAPGTDTPLQAEGTIEVGRPTGLKPGTPLDTPFTLSFPPLTLEPGGYVWDLEVDGTSMARTPFRVVAQ